MRKLISLCLVLTLLVTTGFYFRPTATQAAQSAPPNIVFILLDDLDELTMPYWDALPQTAALLRNSGIRFENAFAPTPVCCPARSSILTGKYGHNTGVLTNSGDQGGWETFVRNGNEERTLAVYLQQAGYQTALVGKYLNGIENAPAHVPPGWTEWHAFVDNLSYAGYHYKMNHNGAVVQYGGAESDYATDVVASHARAFLQNTEGQDNQPFFLYVSPTAPHLPLPPAPRHQTNPYSSPTVKAPQRANYNEPDIRDKSTWLRATGDTRAKMVRAYNDIDYRNRMGSLYAVDEMIASLVQTLDQQDELQNTVIVFGSDNGYNLGAHRLLHKMAPYEESVRVPLVIAGPGITPRVETLMVTEIDFAPTFLELAGAPMPTDLDGTSLVPILRNEVTQKWRTDFLVQYVGGDLTGNSPNGVAREMPPGYEYLANLQDIPTYRALRTQTHTLIEWYDEDDFNGAHEYELYDLQADPYQQYNLLSTPRGQALNQQLVAQMKSRMNQLASCSGASCK